MFASTTHTIEDNQRRGWVLRLTLDKQGVRGFDTRVAQINFEGIPTLGLAASSPCWKRGDGDVGLCQGSELKFVCMARAADGVACALRRASRANRYDMLAILR